MKQLGKLVSPALLLVFLAGCGATTQSVSVKDKKAGPVLIKEKPEQTVAALPEKEVEEDPVAGEESQEMKIVPVPRKPIPEVTVLMGKTAGEIEQVFGRPVLQRKDAPAEVWQYVTDECALHLVFYPAEKTAPQNLVVQYVSMNDRQKAIEVNSRKCFGSQLRRVGEERSQILG